MIEHKDVVLAVLGTSAGLSGLVLVFLGLVVSAYGGLAGDVPQAVKRPLRRTGWLILSAFLLGTGCTGAATWWLTRLREGDNVTLYAATVSLFVAQLLALVLATVWTLRKLLWD